MAQNRLLPIIIISIILILSVPAITASSAAARGKLTSDKAQCETILLEASHSFLSSVNVFRDTLLMRRGGSVTNLVTTIESEHNQKLRDMLELVSEEIEFGARKYGLKSKLVIYKKQKAGLVDNHEDGEDNQEQQQQQQQQQVSSRAKHSTVFPTEYQKCHEKLLKMQDVLERTLGVKQQQQQDVASKNAFFSSRNKQQRSGGDDVDVDFIKSRVKPATVTPTAAPTLSSPTSQQQQHASGSISSSSSSSCAYGPSEPSATTAPNLLDSLIPTDDWIGTDEDVIEEALRFYV